MKSRTFLLFTITLIAILSAYIAGFYAGKGKMDSFCGYMIQGSAAGYSVPLLAQHMAAIDAIRTGKSEEAEKTLHFLAKTDASLINKCKKDTVCAQLMGNPSPEDSQLRKAISN